MIPVLGLCCLTSDSKTISYRTTTKTTFDKLTEEDKLKKLKDIYTANINMFSNAVIYCARNGIAMYRVTSHLFPFYETTAGIEALNSVSNKLPILGQLISELNVRVVMHPDQWVVLSSDKAQVIERSIEELIFHAKVFDLMGLKSNRFNLLNIHGGKKGNALVLINTIKNLPFNVRNRLTLENDEKSYSTKDLLFVSDKTNVPILFDFHHSLINNRLSSYDHKKISEEYHLSKQTWNSEESYCTTHISNGSGGFLDCKHSDFIDRYPELLLNGDVVPYVEVEARGKELAIFALRHKMLTYYQ